MSEAKRMDVLVVREGKDGGKAFFTRVGVAFPAKSGNGYSIFLDALPTDGKLLLREPLPKREAGNADDAF